jgi:hypothetical protein
MTYFVVALLLVAAVVAWWVVQRAARLRRETEAREARVMDALFAARQSANGGANIDVDQIFGAGSASAPASADAVLRSAGVEPELIAMLGNKTAAAARQDQTMRAEPTVQPGVGRAQPPLADLDQAAMVLGAAALATVRDLVQVFYEARGFRPSEADAAARPIELVLTHKADANRSYAFAPVEGPPSADLVRDIAARARAIGQQRVLITSEATIEPALAELLPLPGVRVVDAASIEAQLARLDAHLAQKVRAAAARRAASRQAVR